MTQIKTGLYGGTFDPIHIGHLISAEHVGSALHLDQLVFIPCYDPPHKPPCKESAIHRYNMINEAVRSNPRFKVSSIELDRKGVSYAFDTVKEVKNKYPQWDPLYLIIGIDAFMYIDTWKNYEQLLNMLKIVVTSRPGYDLVGLEIKLTPATKKLLQPIPGNFMSFDTQPDKYNDSSNDIGNSQVYLKVPGIEISASNVRKRLKNGLSVRYLIPSSVKKYIDKHRLYL